MTATGCHDQDDRSQEETSGIMDPRHDDDDGTGLPKIGGGTRSDLFDRLIIKLADDVLLQQASRRKERKKQSD